MNKLSEKIDDCKTLEKNIPEIALNISYAKKYKYVHLISQKLSGNKSNKYFS